MWGIVEDGAPADGVTWDWKFEFDTGWSSTGNAMSSSATLRSIVPGPQDLGAWIVSNRPLDADGTVPEPVSLAVWAGIAGLCGIVVYRRR